MKCPQNFLKTIILNWFIIWVLKSNELRFIKTFCSFKDVQFIFSFPQKIVKAIIIKKIALSVWIILWRHNLKASSAPTHNIHAASIRPSILRLRATQRSSVRAPWFRRLLCYLGKIALWSASKLWTSSMAVLRLSRLLVWWLLQRKLSESTSIDSRAWPRNRVDTIKNIWKYIFYVKIWRVLCVQCACRYK